MVQVFFIVVLLNQLPTISGQLSVAEDFEPSSSIKLISDAMINILNSCFKVNSTNFILSGEIDDPVILNFYHLDSMLSIVIKNSVKNSERFLVFERQPVFIILAPNSEQLQESIESLKTFPLWDINQPFFILHKHGCSPASEFLQKAWMFNMLMSFFLCSSENGARIFTFNPFSNVAPRNWQQVKGLETEFKHPWTLYEQSIALVDSSFCHKLLWNKAKKLDGYPVRLIGTRATPSLLINSSDTSMKSWRGADGEFLKILFTAMNVTVVVKYHKNGNVGHIDKYGNPWGMVKSLALGKQDVLMNSVFLRRLNNSTMVRLNRISGIKFVLKQRTNMSTLEKLVRFSGVDFFIGVAAITSLTFLILRFFPSQSSISALLEIIRLVTNGALLKPPRWISVRIYFGPVLIYYLIFQMEVQGLLDSILTKPIPRDNLETLRDLKAHEGFNLYAPTALISFLDEDLQKRCIQTRTLDCEDKVVGNFTNVCISSESGLTVATFVHNLHMSREQLYANFEIYRVRKDWPLQRRFQNDVLSVEEFGFYEIFKERSMNYSVKKIREREVQNYLPAFSVVTFEELLFAFEGLFLGLTCALLVFLIEFKVWKIQM